MLPHLAFVYLIAHHIEKCQIEHVEKPPVLGRSRALSVIADEISYPVFLFLCICIPDFLLRRHKTDHDGTGLNGLLVSMQAE